jgi:hypothetical protein
VKKILGPLKHGRWAEEFFDFANEAEVPRAQDEAIWDYSELSRTRATPRYAVGATLC